MNKDQVLEVTYRDINDHPHSSYFGPTVTWGLPLEVLREWASLGESCPCCGQLIEVFAAPDSPGSLGSLARHVSNFDMYVSEQPIIDWVQWFVARQGLVWKSNKLQQT